MLTKSAVSSPYIPTQQTTFIYNLYISVPAGSTKYYYKYHRRNKYHSLTTMSWFNDKLEPLETIQMDGKTFFTVDGNLDTYFEYINSVSTALTSSNKSPWAIGQHSSYATKHEELQNTTEVNTIESESPLKAELLQSPHIRPQFSDTVPSSIPTANITRLYIKSLILDCDGKIHFFASAYPTQSVDYICHGVFDPPDDMMTKTVFIVDTICATDRVFSGQSTHVIDCACAESESMWAVSYRQGASCMTYIHAGAYSAEAGMFQTRTDHMECIYRDATHAMVYLGGPHHDTGMPMGKLIYLNPAEKTFTVGVINFNRPYGSSAINAYEKIISIYPFDSNSVWIVITRNSNGLLDLMQYVVPNTSAGSLDGYTSPVPTKICNIIFPNLQDAAVATVRLTSDDGSAIIRICLLSDNNQSNPDLDTRLLADTQITANGISVTSVLSETDGSTITGVGFANFSGKLDRYFVMERGNNLCEIVFDGPVSGTVSVTGVWYEGGDTALGHLSYHAHSIKTTPQFILMTRLNPNGLIIISNTSVTETYNYPFHLSNGMCYINNGTLNDIHCIGSFISPIGIERYRYTVYTTPTGREVRTSLKDTLNTDEYSKRLPSAINPGIGR